jgi:hypothetical protein
MKPKTLLELARNRVSAEELLAPLLSENMADSTRAGQNLVQAAKNLQLSLPDYLRLAIDPEKGETTKGAKLNGFEAALVVCGLPVRDDIDNGMLLQAAAETFKTFPGTRAMFPPVVDEILQWKYRQNNYESAERIVSQTRGIDGIEMITQVVDDAEGDYQATGVIAEGGRIPIRSIKGSEKAVKFYKFGGGVEFTYEFERRASLELVAPYMARTQREVELGKVNMATQILINGDGVNGAAPVVNATDLAGTLPTDGRPVPKTGRIDWEVFLAWLVDRAKKGVPMDTVLGNYDMYLEWLRMFAKPTANAGLSQGDQLRAAGVSVALANPGFDFNVNFALSSAAPAAKLVGFIKAETLEELVENGSDIEESTRAIENQKVKIFKTENRGFRLIFGDTREVLNLNQA